jgi:catechol 2,3-dioxygenase-like lactoylglutathione lyase family enzyme
MTKKRMMLAPVTLIMTALFVLSVAPLARAQLTSARQGPIVYGHHHLTVTSIDESKKFWVDALGGKAVTAGSLEFVKFPNVLVFMREATPTGGSKGTTVNHLGFSVPSTRAMVERVRAAGYPIVTRAELPPALPVDDGLAHIADQDTYIGFAMAPDDVKVEFVEDRSQTESIALHHVHFAGPVDEMKAWYVETFGAAPGMRGSFQAADLPGVNLTYSASPEAPVATQGRSIDHIGFEVDNLKAFCQKLEAQGVTFDRPYGEVAALGLGYAFFTDPFGTYIELTEGLDKY